MYWPCTSHFIFSKQNLQTMWMWGHISHEPLLQGGDVIVWQKRSDLVDGRQTGAPAGRLLLHCHRDLLCAQEQGCLGRRRHQLCHLVRLTVGGKRTSVSLVSWPLKRTMSFSFCCKIVLHTKLLSDQICFNVFISTLKYFQICHISVYSCTPKMSATYKKLNGQLTIKVQTINIMYVMKNRRSHYDNFIEYLIFLNKFLGVFHMFFNGFWY